MSELELAVVRRECGFGMGGAERYCAEVVKGLAARGVNITVIADAMESEVRLVSGSRVRFERAQMQGRGSLMKNMSFFMSARRVLERGKFDLVLGLSRVADADVLRISDPLHAAWLKLGYPPTLFSFLRRFSPRHNSLLSLERRSIYSARQILTNSMLVARQVGHFYKVSRDRITTIYNGYDPGRFYPVSRRRRGEIRQELGLAQDCLILLFAGTNFTRKGLGSLLDALGKSCRSIDFRLLIAGAKSLGRFEAQAEEAGISDRVIPAGYVKDMALFYQASDLFMLPTLYDPFANTCLEAAACGTPVITTKTNGASELIARVSPEFVVESGDSESLAEAIETFIAYSEEERQVLGERFERLASEYTWDRHIDKLMDLFASMHINALEEGTETVPAKETG